jgi:protein-arginine kinase activator protein McsA
MKCKLCEKRVEYDWEIKKIWNTKSDDYIEICKDCFDELGEKYKEEKELFTKEEIGARLMGGGFK